MPPVEAPAKGVVKTPEPAPFTKIEAVVEEPKASKLEESKAEEPAQNLDESIV